MPQNPKYIEEKVVKLLHDFNCEATIHCDENIADRYRTDLVEALEYGFTQGKKETGEEVVREIEGMYKETDIEKGLGKYANFSKLLDGGEAFQNNTIGFNQALNSLKDKLLAKGNKDDRKSVYSWGLS